jgi:hypothetical protein
VTSPGRKTTKSLIGLAAIVAASSLWMRSYNEAPLGELVRTQIGNYKSTESMGLLPISLLKAVRKFATYTDCVEYRDDGTMLPKWSAMENKEQLSVCTFLIADYLGDISKAQTYFNGLKLAANISNTKYDDSGTPILIISCSWLRNINICVFPTIPRLFNAFDNSRYYSIDIYYHKDKPIHSNINIKYL